MNDEQMKVIREAPSVYKTIFERAYTGESRTEAIKAMCLRCVGFLRDEIKYCSSRGCPLHPYRPYKEKDAA